MRYWWMIRKRSDSQNAALTNICSFENVTHFASFPFIAIVICARNLDKTQMRTVLLSQISINLTLPTTRLNSPEGTFSFRQYWVLKRMNCDCMQCESSYHIYLFESWASEEWYGVHTFCVFCFLILFYCYKKMLCVMVAPIETIPSIQSSTLNIMQFKWQFGDNYLARDTITHTDK